MGQLVLDWPAVVAIVTAVAGFVGTLLLMVKQQMELRISDAKTSEAEWKKAALDMTAALKDMTTTMDRMSDRLEEFMRREARR